MPVCWFGFLAFLAAAVVVVPRRRRGCWWVVLAVIVVGAVAVLRLFVVPCLAFFWPFLFCFFFFAPHALPIAVGRTASFVFFSIEDWPRARLAVGSIGGGTKTSTTTSTATTPATRITTTTTTKTTTTTTTSITTPAAEGLGGGVVNKPRRYTSKGAAPLLVST